MMGENKDKDFRTSAKQFWNWDNQHVAWQVEGENNHQSKQMKLAFI